MSREEKNKTEHAVSNYFHESLQELKRVTWPTKNQAVKLTFLVLGCCLVMAFLIGTIDFAFNYLYKTLVDLAPQSPVTTAPQALPITPDPLTTPEPTPPATPEPGSQPVQPTTPVVQPATPAVQPTTPLGEQPQPAPNSQDVPSATSTPSENPQPNAPPESAASDTTSPSDSTPPSSTNPPPPVSQ